MQLDAQAAAVENVCVAHRGKADESGDRSEVPRGQRLRDRRRIRQKDRGKADSGRTVHAAGSPIPVDAPMRRRLCGGLHPCRLTVASPVVPEMFVAS